MLKVVLLSLACAAPDGAKALEVDSQLLVLDLARGATIDEEEASLLSGRIAGSLAAAGLEVVTTADLREMIEVEAERQVLAQCDSSACMSEIADAMGTRFVVSGRVGKLGDEVVLQLNLFDARGARAAAREEITADSLGALARLVEPAALRLVGREPQEPTWNPALVGAGAGALVVGGVAAVSLGIWAAGLEGELNTPGLAPARQKAIEDYGWLTVAGAVVGAAVAVGGGALIWAGLE